MRSHTSPLARTRLALLIVVTATLLLALLPQGIGAGSVETLEQAPGSNCASTHTVQVGDMLSAIAENAGVSVAALTQANNITDPNHIFVGQVLCIPHSQIIAAQAAPSAPVPAPTTPNASQPTGTSANWTGKYYSGQALSGDPLLTRQDAAIEFDWGSGSPDTAVASDSFSVSWTATVDFEAGTYRFSARSDDGVRIYVDDTAVLEDWNVHPATTTVSDTTLTAGSHTVRVEYFEADGDASVTVWWELQEEEAPDCDIQPHDDLKPHWSHSAVGCATAAAETIWSAWQRFEKGHMIWHMGDGSLYVYVEDGSWSTYTDSWDEQELTGRGTPPSGLHAPVRGFGYLWETNDDVYADLGWAKNEEKGFCVLAQEFDSGKLLVANTVNDCQDGQHNFARETPFYRGVLQAVTAGAWERICKTSPDSAIDNFWDQPAHGCATGAASVRWLSLQAFQQGHMLWQSGQDSIYVFVNDGAWTEFSDDWDEQDLTDVRGTPPDGLQSPVRGFGYLWETDDDVYDDLGWATDEERGMCASVQVFENGTILAEEPGGDCSHVGDDLESEETLIDDNALLMGSGAAWSILCPYVTHDKLDHLWSFADHGCPTAKGGIIWAAWQPFQTGHMIWKQHDDALFVFVNDGDWTRYDDDWDSQELTGDRGDAPEGMQTPLRGFGYLWENDDDVYGDLGWATAEERGFCAVHQEFDNGFLLLSDPVDSCLEGHHNEATELDFALHSLEAMDGGDWTLK